MIHSCSCFTLHKCCLRRSAEEHVLEKQLEPFRRRQMKSLKETWKILLLDCRKLGLEEDFITTASLRNWIWHTPCVLKRIPESFHAWFWVKIFSPRIICEKEILSLSNFTDCSSSRLKELNRAPVKDLVFLMAFKGVLLRKICWFNFLLFSEL